MFSFCSLKTLINIKKTVKYEEIMKKMRIFKFWLTILRSDNNSFVKKMYYDMIISNEANPVQSSWVNQLKQELKFN